MTSRDKELQVIELRSKNKTVREIAKKVGISNSSIMRILRRN